MSVLTYNNSEKYFMDNNNSKIKIDTFVANVDIDSEAFKLLNEIENIKIQDKTIEDLFVYDGIALYYFERPTLFMTLKQILFILESLIKITSCYGNIVVNTDDCIMKYICENIFHLNVNFHNDSVKSKKKFMNYFKLALRCLKGIKNIINFKINRTKEKICFITYAVNINTINTQRGRILYDTQVGLLYDKLKEKYNILNLQFLGGFSNLTKANKFNSNYIPFEIFLVMKKLFGHKLINSEKITNELNLINILKINYKNYDISQLIINYVFNNIEIKYENDLAEILYAEKILKINKISKCIATDEGDRARCFITAANRNNIKTFAVQHGLIHERCPEYIIKSKYEKPLVPMLTFVWGERYKNVLTQNSNLYNLNNLRVVGQIRTDLIKKNNNNVISNTSNNNIKILYATQFFKDILEPATEVLFKALSDYETKYEIVVKLHPSDNNYDYYNSKIKQYNIKNCRVVKNEDIYDLIRWSDVIVSVHSTVVVEGALLGKPSICIRLPKYNDAGGFIKDGISLGASNCEELTDKLKSIKGQCYIGEERAQNYIENNFYKVDGNVTNRIYTSIIDLEN